MERHFTETKNLLALHVGKQAVDRDGHPTINLRRINVDEITTNVVIINSLIFLNIII